MATNLYAYRDTTIVGDLKTSKNISKINLYEYRLNLPFTISNSVMNQYGCVSFCVRSFKLIKDGPLANETANAVPPVAVLLQLFANAQLSQTASYVIVPVSGVISIEYTSAYSMTANVNKYFTIHEMQVNLSGANITLQCSGLTRASNNTQAANIVSKESLTYPLAQIVSSALPTGTFMSVRTVASI